MVKPWSIIGLAWSVGGHLYLSIWDRCSEPFHNLHCDLRSFYHPCQSDIDNHALHSPPWFPYVFRRATCLGTAWLIAFVVESGGAMNHTVSRILWVWSIGYGCFVLPGLNAGMGQLLEWGPVCQDWDTVGSFVKRGPTNVATMHVTALHYMVTDGEVCLVRYVAPD